MNRWPAACSIIKNIKVCRPESYNFSGFQAIEVEYFEGLPAHQKAFGIDRLPIRQHAEDINTGLKL